MPELHGLRKHLQQVWYSGHAPWVLRPLAGVYRALYALRGLVYRSGLRHAGHPGVPVVVVGNLTVGGTGKTPLVIWLAAQLQQAGLRVGIVSRGHGGSATGPLLVTPQGECALVGDEALLLASRVDALVCVGRNRLQAARQLAAAGVQVVISDDGLQHLGLQREVEIVVIDGLRGFGNGALLPAGPLREPVARLAGVDAIVLHGAAAGASPLSAADARRACAMHLAPEALVRMADGQMLAPDHLRGRRVHAVAGIGNPQRFFATLRGLGMQPIEHPFPDHHPFTPAELAFGDGLDIVMTQKDAVRCRRFDATGMWFLSVSARLDDSDAARLLQAVYARCGALK